MRPSVARRRRLILLGVNLIAVAVFSFPVYGFIGYMDLNGVAKFVGTAWAGIGLTAAFVWPRGITESCGFSGRRPDVTG